MKKIATMALLTTAMAAAQAQVSVSDCVIQEVIPPKRMTGAFLNLHNEGDKAAVLVSATAPTVTEHVELHEMAVVDGVMSMREIPQYDVTPGDHAFVKGGYHVMLMSIDNPPKVGETHEIDLQFEDGSELSCEAKVLSVDEVMELYGVKGGHDHGHHHDHKHDDGHDHKHGHDHGDGKHKSDN